MKSTIKTINVESLRRELATLKSKNWSGSALRILDQHELSGMPVGSDCTLQVMEYATGNWVQTSLFGSMESLYLDVRITLAWTGPIRLAGLTVSPCRTTRS